MEGLFKISYMEVIIGIVIGLALGITIPKNVFQWGEGKKPKRYFLVTYTGNSKAGSIVANSRYVSEEVPSKESIKKNYTQDGAISNILILNILEFNKEDFISFNGTIKEDI
jgi:hypothetical protein